jgi:hypothetical protein
VTDRDEQRAELLSGLDDFVDDAKRQTDKFQFYVHFWNIVDALTGLPAAVLAALSGVTGLASTTGRIPAAVLALAAAAFAATATFMRGRERYERNHRRLRGWQALQWDGRLAKACYTSADPEKLHRVLHQLVARRRAMMNDDYTAVFSALEDPS